MAADEIPQMSMEGERFYSVIDKIFAITYDSGARFKSKSELVQTIENYIHYYNTRRVQRNLGVLTPMEKHERCLAA